MFNSNIHSHSADATLNEENYTPSLDFISTHMSTISSIFLFVQPWKNITILILISLSFGPFSMSAFTPVTTETQVESTAGLCSNIKKEEQKEVRKVEMQHFFLHRN